MDLAIMIYLVDTLSVGEGMGLLTVLLACITGGLALAKSMALNDKYNDYPNNKNIKVKPYAITLLLLIIWCFIVPSKDTAYRMLAAYGVQLSYETISQSEDVKEMSMKSLKVLDKAMDDYLGETK